MTQQNVFYVLWGPEFDSYSGPAYLYSKVPVKEAVSPETSLTSPEVQKAVEEVPTKEPVSSEPSLTIPEVQKAVEEVIAKEPEPAESVNMIVETEKASAKVQVAKVTSYSSVSGFWALHIQYTNDQGGASARTIRVGSHGDYPLWLSKKYYVEASFSDFNGIVLVPCPENVSL